MSIENAVIEVLSTGEFDECPPDIGLWSDVELCDFGRLMRRRGFCLNTFEDFDIAMASVDSTLTARQHEQMQHYKAEADRADI